MSVVYIIEDTILQPVSDILDLAGHLNGDREMLTNTCLMLF